MRPNFPILGDFRHILERVHHSSSWSDGPSRVQNPRSIYGSRALHEGQPRMKSGASTQRRVRETALEELRFGTATSSAHIWSCRDRIGKIQVGGESLLRELSDDRSLAQFQCPRPKIWPFQVWLLQRPSRATARERLAIANPS